MRKLPVVLIVTAFLVLAVASSQAEEYVSADYGDWSATGYNAVGYSDVIDLTQGPVSLSYTVDMSDTSQSAVGETFYTEVGLREVGGANFNPSNGGWLTSHWWDLATNPDSLDLDDKHCLAHTPGHGEADYDATSPTTITSPFGTQRNYGFWFDRDGVDPWQDTSIANTGGIYDITILFTAVSATQGTMFATINGISQAFSIDSDYVMDIEPAGLSFTGDMTQMQVFRGTWNTSGATGTVAVNDLNMEQTPEPATCVLLLVSAATMGILRRRKED